MEQPTMEGEGFSGLACQPVMSVSAPGGSSGFTLGPTAESILVLCAIVPEFLATSVWPSRRQRTCGSNLQQGWSSTTFFCASGMSFWAAGTGRSFVKSVASTSQTATQRTPLFFGLTTYSSLGIGPFFRQASVSLLTWIGGRAGAGPGKVAWPSIVPAGSSAHAGAAIN